MELVFASHNSKKLDEVRASLGPLYRVESLASLGWDAEIPETEDTLLGNARVKAQAVYRKLKRNCFADDTGLEIEALGGQPGVRTARFAGEKATGAENRAKTLALLADQSNRRATFKTVVVLIWDGAEHIFEGRVEGTITHEEHGLGGFGYDPIFRPAGRVETYAEIPLEETARISHRALAIAQMHDFLSQRVRAGR